MAAIFQADIFCDDCADDIRKRIGRDIWHTASRTVLPDGTPREDFDSLDELWDYLEGMDERHYDSDAYPKYASDDSESDCPEHCGSHDDCLNAGELADGFKYGYCFGNGLTSDGIEYVKEAVRDGDDDGIARLVWAEEYSWIDFEEDEDDDDDDE